MSGRDDESVRFRAGREAPAWTQRAMLRLFARTFCDIIEQAQVLCAEDDAKHMGTEGYTRGQFMLENLGQAAHQLLARSRCEGAQARALQRLLSAISKYRDGDEGAAAGMQSESHEAQRAAICWTDTCLREIFAAASEVEMPGEPYGEWASGFLGGVSRAALLRELARRTPELRRYKQLAGEAAEGDARASKEYNEAAMLLGAKLAHEVAAAADLKDIALADGWRDLRLVLEMDLEVMRLQQAAWDMRTPAPALGSTVAHAQEAAVEYDSLLSSLTARMQTELLRVAHPFASREEPEAKDDSAAE